MSTDTYSAQYKTIRDRLLGYSDGAGAIATYLGSDPGARLYQDTAPQFGTTWPGDYVVMRFLNDRSGQYGERTEVNLELMVYSRPRSKLLAHRTLSDLIDRALKRFTASSPTTGALHVRGRQRDPVLPFGSEADQEVITTRFLFDLLVWPMYLTTTP